MRRPILTSGTHWHDGALKRFSSRLQKILVVRPWAPWPAAWELDLRQPNPTWRGVFPELRVASWYAGFSAPRGRSWDKPLGSVERQRSVDTPPPYLWRTDLRRLKALGSFFHEIPREARLAVSRVRAQWNLLRAIHAAGRPMLDLCAGALPIAYAIGGLRIFHSCARPLRTTRALLSRPGVRRARIMELLSFKHPNTAVRLALRIPIEDLSFGTLLELRRVLAIEDRWAEKLRGHLQQVTRPVLALIRPEYLAHVTPNLLSDVADSNEGYPETAEMLRDLLMLAGHLGRDRIARLRFQSAKALKAAHDDLIRRMPRGLDAEALDIRLPSPPLPPARVADVDFRPLDTFEAICRQGADLHQCLGQGYAERIARGAREGKAELYLYALDARREKATMLIRRPHPLAPFQLEELKAFGNQPSALWGAAREFLRESQRPAALR